MRCLVAVLAVFAGTTLYSRPASADCYEFSFYETPEGDEVLLQSQPAHVQTWCYEKWSAGGIDSTFVHAVGTNPRGELAALTQRNAAGEIVRLSHGSLIKGSVSYHSTADFLVNPMPVPLDETGASMLAPKVSVSPSASYQSSLDIIRHQLGAVPTAKTIYKVSAGQFIEKTPEEVHPYGAYWWPYSNLELSSGDRSPLGKYDNYIESVTGVNPGAAAWETEHHSDVAVAWGGHCNGWAASALLHEEIDTPRWDANNGVFFYNNDINGIYAEGSFCVDWAFYGARNYGTGELEDIRADKFHKVLIYYIKHLQKPVAMDYFREATVDNNVIVGYTMDITAVPDVPTQYNVVVTIDGRNYDMGRSDGLGGATPRNFYYTYTLEVDAQNEIVGGTWTSGNNPDFMWVPLAQENCGRENPNIEPNEVAQLVADLPLGIHQNAPVDAYVDATGLAAGASLPVLGEMQGGGFVLHIENTLPPDAQIVVRGVVAQPYEWWQGEQVQVLYPSWLPASGSYALSFDDIKSIEVLNAGTVPISSGAFHVKSVEYWAVPE